MKTSYKLLVLALIILFGSTAAYDVALRKAYLKWDKKRPYESYDNLNFKNFDRIEITAANIVSTMITQGPYFKVRLHNSIPEAKIEQKGRTLVITFESNSSVFHANHSNALLIECPSLKEIKTNAIFTINGEVMTVKHARSSKYSGGQVSVRGFEQDSLSLVMDNYTSLYFKENKFGFLNANLGSSDSSRSTIYIDNSNQIESADLNLQNNSAMNLKNIFIENFKYKLSDSAQVSLSGISLRLLSNDNK